MLTMLTQKTGVRALAGGWLLLALLALALSTVCAVMLVAARVPLPEPLAASLLWFRSALVLHVSLAVIAWFLCCAAGLWTLAAGALAGPWRWAALALAAIGIAVMAAALFFGPSAPVLANYVPVLDSPVFLTGLGLLLCGVALSGVVSGVALAGRLTAGKLEAWRIGVALSIGAAAMAGAALLASLMTAGLPVDAAGYEVLAWGPGHVLQFVHVLLLMTVWIVLGERASGSTPAARHWLLGALWLAAMPLLAVPVIYLQYPVGGTGFRQAFTSLMSWGSWPAAAMLGIGLLWRLARGGRSVWSEQLPLVLSVLLFLLGCGFGASIRGESTMVPAHYHGTVGAVTLAYMALGYQLLPAFGFASNQGRLVRWQPVIYGIGLIVLACALAWSGWLGVPRKTLHVDVIVQYPAYFAAMGLAGLGGLLAIAGAGLYVVNIVRSLRCGMVAGSFGAGWRELRVPAAALSVGVSLVLGAVFVLRPYPSEIANGNALANLRQAEAHAAQKRKEEIDLRFAQGAALLNARRYEEAASELHRVLELAPQMPEAHVNMGFAMIGVQRYAMARDFFNAALDLNKNQHNAYFGLALALDGLHDLPGALGAMRAYVHLNKSDDAYRRKANAAIWEWEAALQKSRNESEGERQALIVPENEKSAIAYPIREKSFN